MTAPQSGGAERSSRTTRSPGAGNSASLLVLILLAGFVLRLAIAYVFLPGSGFESDLATFAAWARALNHDGPGVFYANNWSDYLPGYLYVLWLGSHVLALPHAGDVGAVAVDAYKVFPMLADVAVAGLLYGIVRSWAGERADAARLGLVAAAIYLFNPVTFYESAVWGQVDAVGGVVILLGVAALVRGNSEGAMVLAVLAGVVKPQFGILLGPLVVAVLVHRHLLRPGSGPVNPSLLGGRAGAWLRSEQGPLRLATSFAAGLAVLLSLLTPFSLDLFGFVRKVAEAAGGYAYLSVNAFNPWALLGAGGQQPLFLNFPFWSPDDVPLAGPLSGVMLGTVLLAGGFLAGMARITWRADRRSIVLVALFLALCFFVLPTRVHERYLFPVFALLPLVAAIDRRWLWATLAISAATLINLHAVLTYPLWATPNLEDFAFGEMLRQPAWILLSIALHTSVFAFVAWRLHPRFARAADPYAAPATGPAGRGRPAESGPPDAGVRRWLPLAVRSAIEVVPLRRDRSSELAGEGGGRLVRVDLLVLLAVFVAALGLRAVNLGHPHGMHFDEVYHARTGVEFLQHWRYGIPHSIYEYTHPHLAKYAMATGVEMLGNNRVTAQRELGLSVTAATLERRWDEDGLTRRGDRMYVAGPHGVEVIDLANQERVGVLDVVTAALVVDEAAHALYLAQADGTIWSLPTPNLDASRDGATGATALLAQPEQLLRLELGSVPRALAMAGDRLLVLGDDGVLVSVDPLTGLETARATIAGASALVAVEGDEGQSLAVATPAGVELRNPADLGREEAVATDGPVSGMALIEAGVDKPRLYAASGDEVVVIRVGSEETFSVAERLAMPGAVRDVYANPSAALVHVLGTAPDGMGDTIYVIEPHSNAVFADAELPFAAEAVLMDLQPRRPAADRLDALAIGADGHLATVDVGSNAFAWRLPGVLAGAAMAACLYLLGRFLFRRRSVALVAAALVLVDGMAFANARIAMNDTYVALFITAAFTVFTPLYVGRWRAESGWRSSMATALGLLGVAVLLGLALSSKWVGAYALGGIILLILLRSALGRLMAFGAMLAMTALLGYLAVASGPETTQVNVLFLGLMVALTTLLAVAITVRPLPLTVDELRLAIAGPLVLGGLALAAGALMALAGVAPIADLVTPGRLLLVGVALLALSPLAYAAARLAARYGKGPLAEAGPDADAPRAERDADASAPPPAGWLRPGSGLLGLPWLAALALLAAVPLAIYVVSYVPWVELGNRWTADFPAGHAGQTFLDLQRSMYDYHNNLRATHAASSPWWAWPLDLKPVWFYQRDFAGATTGVIYNTGNLVVFWLGIPAFAFAAYQAWRRRSLPLTLVVLAAASLWLPWARIDRATFQYHYFTALPFVMLCLAYFVAELWHGPGRRTWMLARIAAATAIVLPALLWIFRLPLCAVARVEQLNPSAEVCQVALSRSIGLTDMQVLGALAAIGGLVALGTLLWMGAAGGPAAGPRRMLLPGLVAVTAAGALLLFGGAFLGGPRNFLLPLDATLVSALFLLLLAVPAWFVLRARDARRYAVGVLVAATLWFVAWYPHISGLPVPSLLANAHLVVLPTLNYSFQFGVNLDPPGVAVDWLGVFTLLVLVASLVGAVVYATLTWRSARSAEASLRTLEETG